MYNSINTIFTWLDDSSN